MIKDNILNIGGWLLVIASIIADRVHQPFSSADAAAIVLFTLSIDRCVNKKKI